MIEGARMLDFEIHGDERGSLVAVENKDIGFEMRRIYYIFDTSRDIVRGKHAHKDLKQVFVCVHGSCDILLDNGREKQAIRLDTPNEGIFVCGLMWREMMNFSDGCVLLVVVDKEYDVQDYIYDYDEFIRQII